MRHLSERARSFINSYYIGSGNKVSVFSKRANPPFEKLKQIYGEELERIGKTQSNLNRRNTSLTAEQKASLRRRLKRENQLQIAKQILSLSIALLITVGLFYGFMALLSTLKNIFKYEQIF